MYRAGGLVSWPTGWSSAQVSIPLRQRREGTFFVIAGHVGVVAVFDVDAEVAGEFDVAAGARGIRRRPP